MDINIWIPLFSLASRVFASRSKFSDSPIISRVYLTRRRIFAGNIAPDKPPPSSCYLRERLIDASRQIDTSSTAFKPMRGGGERTGYTMTISPDDVGSERESNVKEKKKNIVSRRRDRVPSLMRGGSRGKPHKCVRYVHTRFVCMHVSCMRARAHMSST